MVANRRPAPAAGFNLGDLAGYSSGGALPEGDYAWVKAEVMMFQATKQDGTAVGPARLGAQITFLPLAGGEEAVQFYSFGSKAHESWAPNQQGTGIIAVPGGPGTPPNASTNWAMLVKSLYDSGLPAGILSDDLSVLDGMHVHMAHIPEPEERKGFISKTGEAAVEDKPRTIAVVTEIKDDGKPWEGSGGVPEKMPGKPNGRPQAARPAAGGTSGRAATTSIAAASATSRAAAASTPTTEEGEDTETTAINAVSAVLEKSPKGMGKLILRTSTFKHVNTNTGPDAAQKVISTYFGSPETLNGLLGQLGYKLTADGMNVVAA